MKDFVYTTTNPGKFQEVRSLFAGYNLSLRSPSKYGVNLDVEETGETLSQNAILKAEAYRDVLPDNVIVISDDTGVEIDALGGEPGIKVRRWKGYSMTDEEIINYTLKRLRGIPSAQRTAQFHTVIAVAKKGLPTRTFSGFLPGRIVIKPHPIRVKGLPYQPLFYATEYHRMLYKIHDLPMEGKIAQHILTHRERAVQTALPYLLSLYTSPK